MGAAMLSKSLIQFSVDGWSCLPSLLSTWGQTMVGYILLATILLGPLQLVRFCVVCCSQDNHDGVITHLETDILECEVKWTLESIK